MFTAGLLALNRDVLYQIKRKALYQSSPWAAGLLLCCVAVERAVVWADPLGRNTGAWARVLFPFLYYGLWPAVSVTLGLELGYHTGHVHREASSLVMAVYHVIVS